MLTQLWNDEAGFVISAELVLVLTIGVIAMVVGLHAVAKSVTMELNDVANAIGALDQTFGFRGLQLGSHAEVVGSGFQDRQDDCDCTIIVQPDARVKVDQSSTTPESG